MYCRTNLDKLRDEALGHITASIHAELISHQESHPSDPTASNGNLKEEPGQIIHSYADYFYMQSFVR